MGNAIDELETFWEIDSGFFYKVRYREIDYEAGNNLLKLLETIELSNSDLLERRLVSNLWYIPLFLEWQISSLEKHYGKEKIIPFHQLSNRIREEIERILGVPG